MLKALFFNFTNMQAPKIVEIPARKLIGISKTMTIANDKTRELWQQFMPRRKEVEGKIGSCFYSMQVYSKDLQMKDFTPVTTFEKWAVVEVHNFDQVPEGMQTYHLAGGKYVVFIHKGPASAFKKTFDYIYGVWFPSSEFELDQRAHFELLEEGYVPTDPNAEEEIWIPVR